MCRENYFIGLTSKSSKNGSELALKINYRNQKQAQRSSQWFSFFLFALAWPTSWRVLKEKKQHLLRVGFFLDWKIKSAWTFADVVVKFLLCQQSGSHFSVFVLTGEFLHLKETLTVTSYVKMTLNQTESLTQHSHQCWCHGLCLFPLFPVFSFPSFSPRQHDFPSTPVLFHFN